MNHKLESRLPGEIPTILDMQNGRKQRGKRNLMNVKEQSEKSGLNSAFKNVRSWYQFMANRWENSGNSADFIFLGSKITADGDCSYEIKRLLLL